jgi:hypothetical protein
MKASTENNPANKDIHNKGSKTENTYSNKKVNNPYNINDNLENDYKRKNSARSKDNIINDLSPISRKSQDAIRDDNNSPKKQSNNYVNTVESGNTVELIQDEQSLIELYDSNEKGDLYEYVYNEAELQDDEIYDDNGDNEDKDYNNIANKKHGKKMLKSGIPRAVKNDNKVINETENNENYYDNNPNVNSNYNNYENNTNNNYENNINNNNKIKDNNNTADVDIKKVVKPKPITQDSIEDPESSPQRWRFKSDNIETIEELDEKDDDDDFSNRKKKNYLRKLTPTSKQPELAELLSDKDLELIKRAVKDSHDRQELLSNRSDTQLHDYVVKQRKVEDIHNILLHHQDFHNKIPQKTLKQVKEAVNKPCLKYSDIMFSKIEQGKRYRFKQRSNSFDLLEYEYNKVNNKMSARMNQTALNKMKVNSSVEGFSQTIDFTYSKENNFDSNRDGVNLSQLRNKFNATSANKNAFYPPNTMEKNIVLGNNQLPYYVDGVIGELDTLLDVRKKQKVERNQILDANFGTTPFIKKQLFQVSENKPQLLNREPKEQDIPLIYPNNSRKYKDVQVTTNIGSKLRTFISDQFFSDKNKQEINNQNNNVPTSRFGELSSRNHNPNDGLYDTVLSNQGSHRLIPEDRVKYKTDESLIYSDEQLDQFRINYKLEFLEKDKLIEFYKKFRKNDKFLNTIEKNSLEDSHEQLDKLKMLIRNDDVKRKMYKQQPVNVQASYSREENSARRRRENFCGIMPSNEIIDVAASIASMKIFRNYNNS